ncbi:MAG: hypothetical protein A2Y10_06085 [Planctomycetes bacterium GWF2_41_51]|nr:MAG: hypothetical protein A2Y10_06085 [Planctomycetes bacterium GWF2_41_51]
MRRIFQLVFIWLIIFAGLGQSQNLYVPTDFPTIQSAIDAAVNGDIIIVAPSTYCETINFLGKTITVKSSGEPHKTFISGNISSGSVVSFVNGETSKSVIDGFTILGGTGTSISDVNSGGGIFCQNSSPIIKNCIILSNNVGLGTGGGIACYDSSPTIAKCKIINNSAQYGGGIYCVNESSPVIANTIIAQNDLGLYGSGVYCDSGSSPYISKCTIADNNNGVYCSENSNATINNSIIWNNGDDLYGCSATYSCIEEDDAGIGNIHSNPLFNGNEWIKVTVCMITRGGGIGTRIVWAQNTDYHLRYNSPCIDAGDPSSFENEPLPNGGRIDMGAYGNTPEATRSISLVGDITEDGEVDFEDIYLLAEQWLQPPDNPLADVAPIPADGIVNFLDFSLLAENWMKE